MFSDILYASGSQPSWDRGPVNSFFIRRVPSRIVGRARRLRNTALKDFTWKMNQFLEVTQTIQAHEGYK
jgi:hypothetical protein